MSDIVEWLRQPRWVEGSAQRRLFEAADEIERLRAKIKGMEEDEADRALDWKVEADRHS